MRGAGPPPLSQGQLARSRESHRRMPPARRCLQRGTAPEQVTQQGWPLCSCSPHQLQSRSPSVAGATGWKRWASSARWVTPHTPQGLGEAGDISANSLSFSATYLLVRVVGGGKPAPSCLPVYPMFPATSPEVTSGAGCTSRSPLPALVAP